MKSDSGGYYTAMDADSEGIEGKYYTWTQKEIDEVLNNKSGKFSRIFNIMDTGNTSPLIIKFVKRILENLITEVVKISRNFINLEVRNNIVLVCLTFTMSD